MVLYFIALLLGTSLTLAYAPFDLWYVAPVALVGFFTCLNKTQNPFKLGWLFGLGWFGAGISWVHVSIADFGGLPLAGSIALMLLLCGYLALFPALAAWLISKYFARPLWPLALSAIWLATEWLRSWLLTGFPWLSLGYSQLESPLAGWIPVIGETGLSALLIVSSAALAQWLMLKRWLSAGVFSLIVLLSGWALDKHDWAREGGKTVAIALVQGNIKQELRWVPEQDAPTMQKYLNLTQTLWQDHNIVIWPEAAVPKLEPLAQRYLHELDEQAANTDTGLITGIVNYNFETEQAYNHMIALGKKATDDKVGHYQYLHSNRFSKHHLLPIGEFIPLEDWLRGLAPLFDLPMSSFDRGAYRQANLLTNGYRLLPALCFEIAFPRQVRANIYAETDAILTLSNDAWFGNSHGPAQHMQIAQVRAKEFGLPVIRSTNNGITGFIDHKGRIQRQLPQFEEGVLSHNLVLVDAQTPYRYFGDWLAWTLSLVLLTFAWRLKRR